MQSWEKNVRRVIPYVPGEQPEDPKMIKLNTNENPYPPSPKVEEALQRLDTDRLRRYPDPTAAELTKAIGRYCGFPEDQVFVGVGSDDVLAMAFLTFFHSERPVLFPDITYSFYEVWAQLFGISWESPALKEDFTLDPRDYCRGNGGVIFPNPNAPTGLAVSLSQIREILEYNRDSVVIVDEAYVDFGTESAKSLIPEYENLLVVQTFSKSRSLAGMRIGFALGSRKLIRYLNETKYSFNSYTMSAAAMAAGKAAVEDEEYFSETVEKIVKTREWTKEQLRSLGFSFGDSRGNFIFASHAECPARELFLALREAHIYVRYFDRPRISNYLRITVGTQREMELLIDFLKIYLQNRRV